jgi:hypothetical protein
MNMASEKTIAAFASIALVSSADAGLFVALGYDQWKPSLATAITLSAGEYELSPMLNPDGRWEGLSSFFSGGGWDSFQWNVAIWDSNSDATHGTTNSNRLAWFCTNNYGNPNGYDASGATAAFNAALNGDRMEGTTGYPSNAPYRFTVTTAGTYYFGIWDSDLTNNRGGVFFDLHAVPAPAAAPLLALAGLTSRGRRRK